MVKPTQHLLKLCHAGAKHGSEDVRMAAESVLSYIVLHLKHQHAPIPDELVPFVTKLEANVFTV